MKQRLSHIFMSIASSKLSMLKAYERKRKRSTQVLISKRSMKPSMFHGLRVPPLLFTHYMLKQFGKNNNFHPFIYLFEKLVKPKIL